MTSELPPLTGGGVTIQGSASGTRKPGMTIAKSPDFAMIGLSSACLQGGVCYPTDCRGGEAVAGLGCGIIVSSSNNAIAGVALQGFSIGIALTPWGPGDLAAETLPSGVSISRNTITGDVIDAEGYGVDFASANNNNCGMNTGHPFVVCETGDTWLNTTITDNTISIPATGTAGNGVHAYTYNGGDKITGLTISGNTITNGSLDVAISVITAGNGDAAAESEIVISHNRINAVDGMEVSAGGGAAKNTTISGVQILDNTLVLHSAPGQYGCKGIVVHSGGDIGGTAPQDTPLRSTGNVLRDVMVSGNTITGDFGLGIELDTGVVAGESDNQTLNLSIEKNTITTTLAPATGILIINFGEQQAPGEVSQNDKIAGVVMTGDRISMGKAVTGGSDFPGAIAIVAGLGAVKSSSISDVKISGVVVTGGHFPQPALISIVGGVDGATGNTVQRVRITNSKLTLIARTAASALNLRVNDLTDHFSIQPVVPISGNSIRGLTVKGTKLPGGVKGDKSVAVISGAPH